MGSACFPPFFQHSPLLRLLLPAVFSRVLFLSSPSSPVHPWWVPSCSPLLPTSHLCFLKVSPHMAAGLGFSLLRPVPAAAKQSSLPLPEPSRASGRCWGTRDEDGGSSLQKAVLNHRASLWDKDKPWQLLLPTGKKQRALHANTLPCCTAAAPLQHPKRGWGHGGTSSTHPARGHLQLQEKGWMHPQAPGKPSLLRHKSCTSPHRSAIPYFPATSSFYFAPKRTPDATTVPLLAGAGSCALAEGTATLSPYHFAEQPR